MISKMRKFFISPALIVSNTRKGTGIVFWGNKHILVIGVAGFLG